MHILTIVTRELYESKQLGGQERVGQDGKGTFALMKGRYCRICR